MISTSHRIFLSRARVNLPGASIYISMITKSMNNLFLASQARSRVLNQLAVLHAMVVTRRRVDTGEYSDSDGGGDRYNGGSRYPVR